MNEWLQRVLERERRTGMWFDAGVISTTADIGELQKRMRVTLWTDGGVCGRVRLLFDDFPFEEVMSFTFVESAVFNGFSLWLNGREILWQRVMPGLVLAGGEVLEINMKPLNMKFLPFILS